MKGFEWKGWIRANTTDRDQLYICMGGREKWTELRLSTKTKIDSMKSLEKIVAEKKPDKIILTKEQYDQYAALFLKDLMPLLGKTASFNGIPMIIHPQVIPLHD